MCVFEEEEVEDDGRFFVEFVEIRIVVSVYVGCFLCGRKVILGVNFVWLYLCY